MLFYYIDVSLFMEIIPSLLLSMLVQNYDQKYRSGIDQLYLRLTF